MVIADTIYRITEIGSITVALFEIDGNFEVLKVQGESVSLIVRTSNLTEAEQQFQSTVTLQELELIDNI